MLEENGKVEQRKFLSRDEKSQNRFSPRERPDKSLLSEAVITRRTTGQRRPDASRLEKDLRHTSPVLSI